MNPVIKNVSIGGLTIGVAVFLSSILGTGYSGGILEHIEDVVTGTKTVPVVTLNAPNWEFGLSIIPPVITSVSTSSNPNATSGLASSTPYVFEIAALDGVGTTSLISSTTIMTDASTTQTKPENIILNWTPVNGATGYAIFFATSTTVSSSGLSQYFYATTSGTYDFSTSTGSLAGSYTRQTSTAYSELINPSGTDIFNDNLNTSTSSLPASTTAVQINGTAVISASATTTACESDTAGAIFFNSTSKNEWGCNGSVWTKIF